MGLISVAYVCTLVVRDRILEQMTLFRAQLQIDAAGVIAGNCDVDWDQGEPEAFWCPLARCLWAFGGEEH